MNDTAFLTWPAETLLPAQGMRVAIFDVDGVLTDGGLYLDAGGEPLKRFHSLDGHGIRLLQQAGLALKDIVLLHDCLHDRPQAFCPALRDKLRACQAETATRITQLQETQALLARLLHKDDAKIK